MTLAGTRWAERRRRRVHLCSKCKGFSDLRILFGLPDIQGGDFCEGMRTHGGGCGSGVTGQLSVFRG